MHELLTALQMRAWERAAMESGQVTGLELMERAGAGVVTAMLEHEPAFASVPGAALVLCGPGNNGGDGFVIARVLAERGWTISLHLYGDRMRLPPDAAEKAGRWEEIGATRPLSKLGTGSLLSDLASAGRGDASGPDVIIDALFGTGLTRPLGGELAAHAFTIFNHAPGPALRVAVDAPSGLCLDSGRPLGRFHARADLTVTFHRPKLGHVMGQGPALCGALEVVDLGIGDAPPRSVPGKITREVTVEADRADLPGPEEIAKRAGHKYDHGHLLVLSGGVGRGGAARLAARAALRVGAGLVTLGCPPAAVLENASRLDAIMLRPVKGREGLASLLADSRIGTLCLGPGLGTSEAARELVLTALEAGRRAVLDADALSVFAEDPDALFKAISADTLLTPHDGEFARLFPDIAARLAAPPDTGPAFSRVDAAREAAARAGAVVLLKGPDTVVAAPHGEAWVNAAVRGRAAPWLATAGSGDVLSGIAAGLMARHFSAAEAGAAAAWLHVEAAREVGPGLIAEDLPEALPAVFRKLGL